MNGWHKLACVLGTIESPTAESGLHPAGSVIVRLSIAWSLGVWLGAGAGAGSLWVWALLALVLALSSVWVGLPRRGDGTRCAARRQRSGVWLALCAAGCVGSAWLVVQRDYVSDDNIAHVIHEEGALARVVGTIASTPRDVTPGKGTFGAFGFRKPGTLFVLDIEAVDAGDGLRPMSGSILVRIMQHDHRPALGQRVEATGWLSAIGPTQNPGEFDYRAYLQREGIGGRMTLMRRGNWRELGPPPRYTLTGVRRTLSDAAAASLGLGLQHDPVRTGLLEALLLGRRTSDIADLSEAFREVGLAHVLSISGAHLGILLVLVWWLGRLLIGRPAVVAWVVMAVLVLFLLAVPWRTPIIRAAVMAGVFCVGYGFGRRLRGVEMLAGAALIVLVWKPEDLFTAGFQLSFGAVGGLLLFARPVSLWMWPEPEVRVVHPTVAQQAARWGVDYLSVSLVAFLVAVPLVMYHFQLLSPLAALLSLLALPVLTALLGVGYLKVLVGLVLPSASALLAMPVAWLAESMIALVEQGRRLPASSFPLASQPSPAWTAAALAVVVALFSGRFRRRMPALVAAIVLLSCWAVWQQRPQPEFVPGAPSPALEVVMFSVGDGSCYLLRSGGEAVMFDCGSREYLQIGERSIVPGLRALGVDRLEVLMLSHPDLDHFAGALDVIDALVVVSVIVSPRVIEEAESSPNGAAGHLVAELRRRGYEPVVARRGWSMTLGEAELEMLWPAAGFEVEGNNDHSLVLRSSAAGRRVMLNGDIQSAAITALLASETDLRADVMDLPHHGSFEAESPDWLRAVSPAVALQSSGPRRQSQDEWPAFLAENDTLRLTTDAMGMVHLAVTHDGRLVWDSHRGGAGALTPPARSEEPR